MKKIWSETAAQEAAAAAATAVYQHTTAAAEAAVLCIYTGYTHSECTATAVLLLGDVVSYDVLVTFFGSPVIITALIVNGVPGIHYALYRIISYTYEYINTRSSSGSRGTLYIYRVHSLRMYCYCCAAAW